MTRKNWVAAILALCLLPAPVLADQHEESEEKKKPGFGRRGFYMGLGFAYGFGDFYENAIEDEIPIRVNVDDAPGLNARVGYRVLSFLAFEAHYEWINDFNLDLSGLDVADQTTHTITGNLKLLLPLWRFQPYLMLGVGAQYYDIGSNLTGLLEDNDWAFAGRPALGIDFYITRHLVFNVEGAGVIAVTDLSGTLSSVDTLPYVSVGGGFQWRF